jgi:outer membrane protein assembly factor BamD
LSNNILRNIAAIFSATVIVASVFSACAPRKQFDPTPEGEFESAYDYFQKGKYSSAIESFKQLIYKYPGSERVEEARFYMADSYFNNGEHKLAADEFERMNREFPQGRFAEVSMFKAAMSYDKMSRRIERDQAESLKALETLELMLAKYPNTTYNDTAVVHIRSLKNRLAKKEYKTAMFYLKRKFYDSAIIYLKSVLEKYPETEILPATLYYLYQASDKMGYPDDAEDAKSWLCSQYPETEYARELSAASDSVASKDSPPSP